MLNFQELIFKLPFLISFKENVQYVKVVILKICFREWARGDGSIDNKNRKTISQKALNIRDFLRIWRLKQRLENQYKNYCGNISKPWFHRV